MIRRFVVKELERPPFAEKIGSRMACQPYLVSSISHQLRDMRKAEKHCVRISSKLSSPSDPIRSFEHIREVFERNASPKPRSTAVIMPRMFYQQEWNDMVALSRMYRVVEK
jgi:hypothetical protein